MRNSASGGKRNYRLWRLRKRREGGLHKLRQARHFKKKEDDLSASEQRKAGPTKKITNRSKKKVAEII